MKKKFKILFLTIAAAVLICLIAGCSEAERVNHNMSKQADYFECERKITVYNARTDNIILEAEGFMSISNNTNNELVVTVKTGPNEYKKNYVYLNKNFKFYFKNSSVWELGLVPNNPQMKKYVKSLYISGKNNIHIIEITATDGTITKVSFKID